MTSGARTTSIPQATPLLSIELREERDVVVARQRVRQIMAIVGFGQSDQTAFATAASELARNALCHAGRGAITCVLRGEDVPALVLRVQDDGPGIANLGAALEGSHRASAGGLVAARRLSDEFDVASAPGGGTTVTIARRLPPGAPPAPAVAATVAHEFARRGPRSPMDEVREQNRELLAALDELRQRQAEVERLNAELAETNRGVVALYAELDEKAESLRRASEYKTRFLSDMTHELRTPLNAIVSLARLLIDRVDGELTPEQERQATLIWRSATSLGEMVNDLLDLAKIEAGKTDLHVSDFHVADVLAALRGMFRPLVAGGAVALRIEEPADGLDAMRGDERKLSQILRNLLSNAIKFTERGEVSLTAGRGVNGTAVFAVRDTGVGLAPGDIEKIFADFAQIDGPIQRRVRGTGLGLPLTRKLAGLMGGDVRVESAVGVGSTFTLTLPVAADAKDDEPEAEEAT